MPARLGLYADQICTPSHLRETLESLRLSHGVQASSDYLFRGAFFGRDSVQVGLDVVAVDPDLAEHIIVSLARCQGIQNNPATYEQPGKIHHEHRNLVGVSKDDDPVLYELFEMRCADFGFDPADGWFTYYDSVDATPNFVRLVGEYCRRYGFTILDRHFQHQGGARRSVRDAVSDAVNWVVQQITASDIRLVESSPRRKVGQGLPFMRDGSISYVHPDGRLVNIKAPVASLEVQGLAYDALLVGCEILPQAEPALAWERQIESWRKRAKALRTNIFRRFWMEDKQAFAMAIDRSEDGKPRQVATPSSVQAELLETRLFDELPSARQRKYVSAIVRQMYDDEFLTDVGIRMRPASLARLTHYCEYQGAKVSWVVTSNIFARGLRKQGLHELACDMEIRYCNGLDVTGRFVEFWYVEDDGTVFYFAQSDSPDRAVWHITATNLPERTQAWTVSAAFRALAIERKKHAVSRPVWKEQLTAEIDAWLREPHTVYVDVDKGQRQERSYLRVHK